MKIAQGGKKTNYILDRKYIFYCYIPVVIMAKIIRYTLMKEVLVDEGIGHNWMEDIVSGVAKLGITGGANEVAPAIFSYINILQLETYFSLEIYITIIWNLLTIVILQNLQKKMPIMDAIFVFMSIAVLNIFCFTVSKEPIQMLYFILLYYIIKSKMKYSSKMMGVSTTILLMCTTYRTYYILMFFFFGCAFFLGNYYIKINRKIKWYHVTVVILAIGIIYFIFLHMTKNLFPAEYTELIRVRLRQSAAASDMRVILPGSSSNLFIFSMDYIIMIGRMMLPVELLRLGIKYVPYVVFQFMVTYYVIRLFKGVKNRDNVRNITLYIYLGFLFCSAAFEPDFGSWVRHEAVVFPIMMFFMGEVKHNHVGRDGVKKYFGSDSADSSYLFSGRNLKEV